VRSVVYVLGGDVVGKDTGAFWAGGSRGFLQPRSVSLNDAVYVLKEMESTYTDDGNVLNMVLEARGMSIGILLAHFGRTIRSWKC
jgi:hypothetical protein